MTAFMTSKELGDVAKELGKLAIRKTGTLAEAQMALGTTKNAMQSLATHKTSEKIKEAVK